MRMNAVRISILSFLFIFAMAPCAGGDSDKSINHGAHRISTMKIDGNRDAVQKKKSQKLSPTKSNKKGYSKPGSALGRVEEKSVPAAIKRDMDFLKRVEEKRKAEWIHLDHHPDSPEFSRTSSAQEFFAWRGVPGTPFPNTGLDDPIPKSVLPGDKYLGATTKLEALKHLKSRELLREIFMGLRFSFIPTSRHMVLEMNVNTPFSENGPGLKIPF